MTIEVPLRRSHGLPAGEASICAQPRFYGWAGRASCLYGASELQKYLSRQLTTTLAELQEFGLQEKASRSERQQFTKRRRETITRDRDFASPSARRHQGRLRSQEREAGRARHQAFRRRTRKEKEPQPAPAAALSGTTES